MTNLASQVPSARCRILPDPCAAVVFDFLAMVFSFQFDTIAPVLYNKRAQWCLGFDRLGIFVYRRLQSCRSEGGFYFVIVFCPSGEDAWDFILRLKVLA